VKRQLPYTPTLSNSPVRWRDTVTLAVNYRTSEAAIKSGANRSVSTNCRADSVAVEAVEL
jgi:hypothetical protein